MKILSLPNLRNIKQVTDGTLSKKLGYSGIREKVGNDEIDNQKLAKVLGGEQSEKEILEARERIKEGVFILLIDQDSGDYLIEGGDYMRNIKIPFTGRK